MTISSMILASWFNSKYFYKRNVLRVIAEFLKKNEVDLIFMDIQLTDGNSFNIFSQVNPSAYIIFTTAYDKYALEAFEHNAIGYLLKPLNEDKFISAVNKIMQLKEKTSFNENLASLLQQMNIKPKEKEIKRKFILKFNDKIKIIDANEIVYLVSENRNCYLVTFSGDKYFMDDSLSKIITEVDNTQFYPINRSYIINVASLENIEKYFNSTLKITLNPKINDDIVTISRENTADFLHWIEINN